MSWYRMSEYAPLAALVILAVAVVFIVCTYVLVYLLTGSITAAVVLPTLVWIVVFFFISLGAPRCG